MLETSIVTEGHLNMLLTGERPRARLGLAVRLHQLSNFDRRRPKDALAFVGIVVVARRTLASICMLT